MDTETILKFVENRASLQEQDKVLKWIKENPENRKIYSKLKNIDVAMELATYEADERRRTIFKYVRMSAKIAAVLVIAFSIFYFGESVGEGKWEKFAADQLFKIQAPYGEKLTFTLPDNTEVILNSGTVLQYSNLYGYVDRTVYLTGEGYFRVKKGEKKFNVIYPIEKPLLKTTVLGTEFNISSYSEDNDIVTDLYEGSIEIEDITHKETIAMSPNTRLVFSKETSEVSIKPINNFIKWIDSYVIAESEDIVPFSKKLEKIFNVEIVVSTDLAGTCSYSGVLYGESLRQILDNMSLVSPIKYTFMDKGKTVIIQHR